MTTTPSPLLGSAIKGSTQLRGEHFLALPPQVTSPDDNIRMIDDG